MAISGASIGYGPSVGSGWNARRNLHVHSGKWQRWKKKMKKPSAYSIKNPMHAHICICKCIILFVACICMCTSILRSEIGGAVAAACFPELWCECDWVCVQRTSCTQLKSRDKSLCKYKRTRTRIVYSCSLLVAHFCRLILDWRVLRPCFSSCIWCTWWHSNKTIK